MFFTWTTEKKKPFPEMERTVKATGLGGCYLGFGQLNCEMQWR